MAPTGAPPTSPQVRQQQMPPMAMFAGQGGPAPDMEQPMGMDVAEASLNEVAAKLMDVAKVLASDSPQLMPILQKMVQAGAMLMSEIKTAKGAVDGSGQTPPLAQGAGPEGGGDMTMSG